MENSKPAIGSSCVDYLHYYISNVLHGRAKCLRGTELHGYESQTVDCGMNYANQHNIRTELVQNHLRSDLTLLRRRLIARASVSHDVALSLR